MDRGRSADRQLLAGQNLQQMLEARRAAAPFFGHPVTFQGGRHVAIGSSHVAQRAPEVVLIEFEGHAERSDLQQRWQYRTRSNAQRGTLRSGHEAGTAMSEIDTAIKRMKLYQHLERVERALDAATSDPQAPCPPETFEALDQLHYEGHDAVDHAAARLGLGPDSRVLDAGSGLGGPARWLAHKHGCRVLALELQPELDDAAARLTERCGLEHSVEHLCGDILDPDQAAGPFDALVSWLVFLHIPDRPLLLARCRQRLRAGGGLYAEDFYIRAPLNDGERALLRDEVYCTHLVDRDRYCSELEAAGFESVRFEDRTAVWTTFVAEREKQFLADRDRFVIEHDTPTFEALASFYRTMRGLFDGGRLGGARISALASNAHPERPSA